MKYLAPYQFIILATLMFQACAINKFDKHGNRTGKWKSYWDDKQIQAVGKYKADWQKGVWKYYDQNGNLSQKQIHHKDKSIQIIYYYPNGKIESQGEARIVLDDKVSFKYYWYGKWQFYNQDGTLKSEKHYLEGQAMEEEEFTK